MLLKDAKVTFEHSTISNNRVTNGGDQGGGIYSSSGAILVVKFCTFVNNVLCSQCIASLASDLVIYHNPSTSPSATEPILINNKFENNTLGILDATRRVKGHVKQCRAGSCHIDGGFPSSGIQCEDQVNDEGMYCSDCSVGRFMPKDSTYYSCILCHRGKFSNDTGQSECTDCPPGRYQDRTGESSCALCKRGQYSSEGSITCVPVPVGFYADNCLDFPRGCRSQSECPAGSFCNGTSILPVSCPSGSTSISRSYMCSLCAIGKAGKGGVCLECVGNSIAESPGLVACSPCKLDEVATTRKSFCIPRVTQAGTRAIIAQTKPRGHDRRQLELTWKLQGDFSLGKLAQSMLVDIYDNLLERVVLQQNASLDILRIRTSLLPIPVSHRIYEVSMFILYNNGSKSPVSRYGADVKRSWLTVYDCTDLQYLNDEGDFASWSCNPCPLGASCSGPITWAGVKARFGYWREGRKFYRCLIPAACLGAPNPVLNETKAYPGNVDHNESCNTTVDVPASRLCASCKFGYVRGASLGSCTKCSRTVVTITWFILAIVLSVCMLIVLIIVTVFKPRVIMFSDGVKKIALSYVQLSMLGSQLRVPWSSAVRSLFHIQGVCVGVTESFLSVDCLLQSWTTWELFRLKYLSIFFFPVLVVPIAYIGIRVGKGTLHQLHATIVLLFYLFYPTVAQKTGILFTCIHIGGVEYFALDPEIQCWQGAHANLLVFGFIAVCVYVVGLPLLGMFLLYKTDRLTKNSSQKFGILYDGYNDHYWWWELVVMARKLFMIIICVFLKESQQLLLVLLMLLVSLVWTSIAHPFTSQTLHLLELASLSICFLTYWSGAWMFTDVSSGLVVAIIVLGFNILGVGGLMVLYTTSLWNEKLREMVRKTLEHDGWKKHLMCFHCCCRGETNTTLLSEVPYDRRSRNSWIRENLEDSDDRRTTSDKRVQLSVVKS